MYSIVRFMEEGGELTILNSWFLIVGGITVIVAFVLEYRARTSKGKSE